MYLLDQYQTFDDQHDRMSGVVDVANDAENRVESTKTEVDKLATSIVEMNTTVALLESFAGTGIRDVTDKG